MTLLLALFTQGQFDNIIGTVVGGIAFTIILFLSREYLFRNPDVSGIWTLETETTHSNYHPYVGLKIKYHLILVQLDNQLKGTWEKLSEENSNTNYKHNYPAEARTTALVEGSITKRYFSRSEITLHIIEDGQKRISSSVHTLKYYRQLTTLKGTFFTTAGDSKGFSKVSK